MKRNKQWALLAITAIFALAFIGCGGNGDEDPPKPHEGTITAFDRTINVIGDASISVADWNTAKGKLEEAIVELEVIPEESEPRNKVIAMLDRDGFTVIIGTGNAGFSANSNKSMTVGVEFLLSNNDETILSDLYVKIIQDNAFAD